MNSDAAEFSSLPTRKASEFAVSDNQQPASDSHSRRRKHMEKMVEIIKGS